MEKMTAMTNQGMTRCRPEAPGEHKFFCAFALGVITRLVANVSLRAARAPRLVVA